MPIFAVFLLKFIMKIRVFLALFALFSLSSTTHSQTVNTKVKSGTEVKLIQNNDFSSPESVNYIVIFYGDKLKQVDLSIAQIDEYSWEISNNDSYKINGIGRQILDIIFQKPGEYDIVLNHTEKTSTQACNHSSEKIIYRLKVLDSKYEFLFDELTLSNSIVGDIESKGLILTVPVIYSCYNDKPGDRQGLKIISSGVNTSIIGEVVGKDTPLQVGKNLISFSLSGKATPNTYIMFDFYNQDNLIQTYYLPNVIK